MNRRNAVIDDHGACGHWRFLVALPEAMLVAQPKGPRFLQRVGPKDTNTHRKSNHRWRRAQLTSCGLYEFRRRLSSKRASENGVEVPRVELAELHDRTAGRGLASL